MKRRNHKTTRGHADEPPLIPCPALQFSCALVLVPASYTRQLDDTTPRRQMEKENMETVGTSCISRENLG